ncbi:hypothetical protein [Actinomadura decatromicini]|nr:hypothetical protein [Actinomadura decatromicini]
MLSAAQAHEEVSISVGALLVASILIMVAVAAYKDPKLATAIGTACAVGALLLVALKVSS